MKRHCLAAWAIACFGALAAAGGCCAPTYCGDCGPHDIVAAAPCKPCVLGPGEGVSPQCVACGVNGPCPKHIGGRGLLGFMADNVTCGAGCGEFYVHPWINDPPHPYDPCDPHGNWIGPQPYQPCAPQPCTVGGCPVGWHNFWGHRSDIAGCCADHYVEGPHFAVPPHGMELHGEVIHGPTLAEPLLLTPPQEPSEMDEVEEVDEPDTPPTPPEFPGPAGNNSAKSRSALKKFKGRPAVYYSRRPKTILR